jgi:hypothetical protein
MRGAGAVLVVVIVIWLPVAVAAVAEMVPAGVGRSVFVKLPGPSCRER